MMQQRKDLQKVLQRQQEPINVIYVSSYIPRKCGIATYTKDLTNAINLLNSHSLAEILAVNQPEEDFDHPWEAKFKINQNDLSSYLNAARYVNESNADLVVLQHEFGLFGGDGGEYIMHFVEALDRPLISTFHTVLESGNDHYAEILKRLAKKSEAIIVMMHEGAERLTRLYDIPANKIVVIPHGVPDLPFNDAARHKKKRKLGNRIVLGNINLLSPWKGIEYSLQAVAQIARKYPEVLYMVIGQTHPTVLQQHGESYRNSLRKLVRELGIVNNVRFVNEYLSLPDLIKWLKALDFYITPYVDPNQVTSGALAYALGAGKACISTSYIYAREVLADNRGVLVPFRDPDAIANAVIRLLENPEEKQAIEENAYRYGRLMTWPNVANSHLNVFRTVLAKHNARLARKAQATPTGATS